MFKLCAVAIVLATAQAGDDHVSLLQAKARMDEETTLRQDAKPHIILFLADDLGYNDLGFHQNQASPINPAGEQTTTDGVSGVSPIIDRLVSESVVMQNYYVQSVCTPTRATLMTGRYPFHTGMGPGVIKQGQAFGLAGDETVLAETMRDAGYACHMIGKWHLGDLDKRWTPTFRGFESYLGYLMGKNEYFQHTDSGGLDFRKSKLNSVNVLAEQTNEYQGQYSSLVYAERLQEIVDNRDDRPIFLYYSPNSVHSMYTGAPQSDLDQFTGPNFEGVDGDRRKVSYAMVKAMDEMIEALETSFKNAGLWDNTVFCFSNDNGGNPEGGVQHPGMTVSAVWSGGSNFPMRGWKGTDFEAGIRGIGFIRGSTNLAPLTAGTNDALMHVSDWYPTIIAIAGGTYQGSLPLDGVDQWQAISNGASAPRTSIVHNCPHRPEGMSLDDAATEHGYSAVIRKGDFKLLYENNHHGYVPANTHQDVMLGFGSDSPLMCDAPAAVEGKYLFNIAVDPRECTNLAGNQEYQAQMADLIAEMEACSATAVPDISVGYDGKFDLWMDGKANARTFDSALGVTVWTEWDCKAAHPDEDCGWPVR